MIRTNQSSLLGYALLKASFDAGNSDPLDALLPIVDRSLINSRPGTVDISELQRTIKSFVGLDIPLNVIKYTLPRLKARGRVKLIDGIYYINSTKSELSDTIAIENASREVYDRVASSLRALTPGTRFSAVHPSALVEEWLDTSAVSFVGDTTRYAARSREDRDLNWLFLECMNSPAGDQFIDDLSYLAVGDVLFRAIKTLTEIDSEADTLQDFPTRMKNVDVYLDTRLALRCLGIGRTELVRATTELATMCKRTGCSLLVFDHTADEVQSAFGNASENLRLNRHLGDDIIVWARSEGMSPSDILEYGSQTIDELQKVGINTKPAPIIERKEHFDEKGLEERLKSAMEGQSDKARAHDIRSISGIHHRRLGRPKIYLERCDAILVTTNKPLADETQRFFRSHYKDLGLKHRVQLCMTDNVFATRLWTKLPTNATHVPRAQIISHIYSNLAPSKQMVESFTNYLDMLQASEKVSTEDITRVRLSRFAREMISQEARRIHGAPTTADNTAIYKAIVQKENEITRRNSMARSSLAEERENNEKLRQEVESLKAQLEAVTAASKDVIGEIEVNDNDVESADDALEAMEHAIDRRGRYIVWRERGRRVTTIGKVLSMIIVLTLATALSFLLFDPISSYVYNWASRYPLLNVGQRFTEEEFLLATKQASGAVAFLCTVGPILFAIWKR